SRLTILAAFFTLMTASYSSAAVIIHDTYTDLANTALTSHSPDVNLTGNSYLTANGSWAIGAIAPNTASAGGDSAFGLGLASAGGYTKPTDFTISADLNLVNMVGSAGEDNTVGHSPGFVRGITLGFYATVPSVGASNWRGIAGVTYNDNGN